MQSGSRILIYLLNYFNIEFSYLKGMEASYKSPTTIYQAFFSEMLLTCFVQLSIIYTIRCISPRFIFWTIIATLNFAIYLGSTFSGPKLNAFDAITWHSIFGNQKREEYVLIYFVAPLLGGVITGLVYKAVTQLFTKQKRQRSRKPSA